MEVYNDSIRDLISSDANLELRHDKSGLVSVEGLQSINITSLDSAQEVIQLATKNRAVVIFYYLTYRGATI